MTGAAVIAAVTSTVTESPPLSDTVSFPSVREGVRVPRAGAIGPVMWITLDPDVNNTMNDLGMNSDNFIWGILNDGVTYSPGCDLIPTYVSGY